MAMRKRDSGVISVSCRYCGQVLQEEWKYCPYCKRKVEIFNCPYCREEVKVQWDYCPYCKNKVKDRPQVDLSFDKGNEWLRFILSGDHLK